MSPQRSRHSVSRIRIFANFNRASVVSFLYSCVFVSLFIHGTCKWQLKWLTVSFIFLPPAQIIHSSELHVLSFSLPTPRIFFLQRIVDFEMFKTWETWHANEFPVPFDRSPMFISAWNVINIYLTGGNWARTITSDQTVHDTIIRRFLFFFFFFFFLNTSVWRHWIKMIEK